MTNRRVGILMGGWSGERDVSLKTGEGVARALEARGHRVVRIAFGEGGTSLHDMVRDSEIDVAFIALHGRGGEDGCVQGLLETMCVPYTGSSVLASALAMDKVKSKELFRLHNVPTPPHYVVTRADLDDLEETHGSFGFPVIVKPRAEGSSIGVSKASSMAELAQGIRLALENGTHAIVERFVRAMEVHVGILDGRVLGAIEVVPKSGLYDYASKYTPGATEYICPPRLSGTRARGVMNLAERAARALGCTGACRVDVLVTEGENEYVLEVNTLPGMTPTSLLPKIAAAAGIDYATLCESILATAATHSGLRRAPANSQVEIKVARSLETVSIDEAARKAG